MSVKRAFFSVFQKSTLFCCAIFFGFANAFSANLPSGYTELEYIQGDGNSWIETNVNATNNSSAEIKFVLLNEEGFPAVFGARESKTSRAFNVWGTLGSDHTSMGINIGNLGAVGLEISPQIGTEYTLSMSATNLTINGVSKSISGVPSFTTPGGVWVFNTYGADASGSGTGNRVFVGRIYYVKMYNNGVLVLNLVPVKRISGNTTTIGMYDTVNNEFYQNAGTGTFTAGPVVGIKIATTAYNAARFSSVQTDLNNAVATIRDIVTKTINQTAAIASLQADKQTRPEDACPAGKKCLLVETEENGVVVPHWFPIIENIYGLPAGYTALEYIETSGSQYIVLPNFPTASNIDITTDVLHTDGTNEQIFLAPASGIQYLYTVSTGWRVWKSGGGAANIASLGGRHSIKIKTTSSGCEYYVDGQKNTDVPASLFTSAEFSGKTFNLGARTFASGGDYYWKGRIYSFYAECDNEECMNLVPAKRNSDGAIGMYDLTNLNPATAFYTNSGTGTFTAGPEM